MRASRLPVVVLLWALAAPASAEPLVDYVVQPGESCWSIAERLFGDGARYDLIHRYNDLGPLPHLLVPGTVLKVPASVGQPDAKVGVPRHEVKARAPTAADWKEAYPDMALWRLFRVATGDASSAEIRFRDLSSLVLRESALLVIHGGGSGTARLERKVKTTVELEKGAVYGGLASLDRASDLAVHTPAADVDLMATLAQVSYEEDRCTRVSVFEGQAAVAAQGERVQVPPAFGTAVPLGKVPQKPRPLPPPVAWEQSEPLVVRVPPGATGAFEAGWKALDVAARYRVELARDDRFRDLVADAVVGAGVLRFRGEDLAPGDYRARVSAIDGSGLQGMPSATRAVSVSAVGASARLQPGAEGWEVAGAVRLAAPADVRPGEEVRVDGGAWRPAGEALLLVEPGPHRLEWRAPGTAFGGPLALRVLEIRGTAEAPDGPLRPGDRVEVRLAFADERGRPALPPGMVVRAEPGGDVPFVEGDRPGQRRAALEVPAFEAPGTLVVQAGWPGGEGAAVEIPVDPGVKAVAVPSVRWPLSPPRPEWGRTVAGLPNRPLQSVHRLGLSVFSAAPPAARHGQDPAIRAALSGEASLAGGRLGLDLDVALWDGEATAGAGRWRMGDSAVGLRYVGYQAKGLSLGPRLRLVVPTSRRGDPWRVEPGLALEWNRDDRVAAGLSETLGLGLGGEDPRDVTSTTSIWAAWRPLRFLEVSAGLDAVMGIAGRDPPRAVLVAGALSFPVGRFRLGIHAGGGATRDGRDLAGDWTAGLHLEAGFPGGAP
jgi:hypothetical protein